MPLHVLIGPKDYRTRQTHLLPGTSPADRPHYWVCVDYRKSRLSVPIMASLGPLKLREGEPGVSPPIPLADLVRAAPTNKPCAPGQPNNKKRLPS